mgnify:FL=1
MKQKLHRPIPYWKLCKKKGWKRGDYLRGTEYFRGERMSTTTILITAVGDTGVLARPLVDVAGTPAFLGYESMWSLAERRWRKVSPPRALAKSPTP